MNATFTDLCWAIRLEVAYQTEWRGNSAKQYSRRYWRALQRKMEAERVNADEREHYAMLARRGEG